ncbi:MAG: MG2 domain-containing protein [Treponema sp.]|nr:MG2 domain-containing protein [Treponema sp.]
MVINRLPLEYEKNYQVHVSGNVKDIYGRTLGQDKTVRAQVGQANSYVYFLNSGPKMLEAGFLPRVVWETQNPVSLRSLIKGAASPYERVALSALKAQDISKLPKNSKRFFMEDLAPFLGSGGKGSAAMGWEYETRSEWNGKIYKSNNWLTVQVTDIGITVRYAYNMVLVWATKLSTGAPLPNAKVELREGKTVIKEGKTDDQGLAVFQFADGEFVSRFTDLYPANSTGNWDRGFRVKVIEGSGAMAGGDEAEFIPNGSHNQWRFDVEAYGTPFDIEKDKPLIFLFTDRGLYKPGETVTFRGIDRNLSRGQFLPYSGDYSIDVSSGAYDAPVIASLKGTATKNGGSYGSFKIPENLEPGRYVIRYARSTGASLPAPGAALTQAQREAQRDAMSRQQTITFTVANFERLRFEASLTFPDLLYYQGDKISGRLSASYLSGGGLTGAPYTYYWTREPAGFVPGNNAAGSGATSGTWRNWRFGPETYDNRYFAAQGEGSLGPDGGDDISYNVGIEGIEGITYRYRLEASVQDAARQEISARAAVIVHPASFYIASRLDKGSLKAPALDAAAPSAWFLSAGSPASMSWALVDAEGNPLNQSAANGNETPALSFKLIRYEWKQSRQAGIGGRINLNWEKVEETVMEQNLSPGKGEYAGVVPFTPAGSGQWEIRISGKDSKGRTAQTRYSFYVTGSGWVHWGGGDEDSITLTPDKSSYAPGETAKLLVRSPLPKGKYLLTIEREGILDERIIDLDGSALTIDVPIKESYVPIVYASIASYTVRSGPPKNTYYEPDLDKPKGLFGLTGLFVDQSSRHYKIDIESAKGAYSPAEEAEVTLKVSQNGKPAPGVELTFMAVDRGVVDLIDYHVPDPLAFFYNPRNFPLAVRGADSRSMLIDPVTYSLTDLQGGDEEDTSKLDERKDFRPTAVFEPYLVTGPDGTVKVKFGLPDSLTTYRCTAVAAGLQDFGIAEQDLKVSAPLTATAALPRKLRWRDTGTISLLLTNLDKDAVEAKVSVGTETINSSGLWDTVLEIDGEKEKTVKINPGASTEVAFKAAALGAGESRITFTLRSPSVNERIIKTLKVDRPVLYETVTAIGSLGNENPFIEEGVVLPSLVPQGTGSLSVSLSASRLALLKEAVRYLLDYPYGCLEQHTAVLLPLIAFADRLDTFELDSPVKDPKKVIEGELARIAKSQLQNGAFPYWPGGKVPNDYVTLRVAHIAALAKQKGYTLPAAFNTQTMLAYISALDYTTSTFSRDPFLKGYSLWVRAMYGERIGTEISAYLKQGDELGISGWGFAGLAALELGMKDLASSTMDRVKRFIRPGTRTLDLTDTYEQKGNFWGSDADRYAIALMLWQALSPADDMTTRLANSLIERQRRGIWTNTSSSYWAVLAFSRVADAEEKDSQGSLNTRLSLGGKLLMGVALRSFGGVPAFKTWTFGDAPLSTLQRDTLLPLRIEREGTGRLYYTASLRYGIPTELASARDEGLSVFAETYDPAGNLVKDGLLMPGKTYTRKVTISSSRDRTFVALRAPVPSGAEIVDAAFVTSSTVPPKEDTAELDDSRWQDCEEPPVQFIMDDEVQFNWDFLPAGKKEVEFRFRAVMPGIYPTPPAQAECMYEPEVFGRGAGELNRIGK